MKNWFANNFEKIMEAFVVVLCITVPIVMFSTIDWKEEFKLVPFDNMPEHVELTDEALEAYTALCEITFAKEVY